ncbi:MAG TPA: translation elongation factor Ts [bacterium]|nr:translation elongation factor Ts [bacterium]HPP88777.1 translation elongation factor Ts [bacterium]
MAITAKMVQELRDKTGAGMMDCKKALTETNGDMEAAVKFLREKGLAAAANKSSKTTAEGIVKVILKSDRAAIAEINCETDFVARNDGFLEVADRMINIIFDNQPKTLDELKNLKIDGMAVSEYLAEFIAKIGENVQVRRFDCVKIANDEIGWQYIHGGGKIGVLAKFKISDTSKKDAAEFIELMKDICMQIAASEPKYIAPADVSKEDMDNERAIYTQQMKNEGKPEHIISKIVEGKLVKYYEQVCLVEQVFIKDAEKKVKQVIDEASKKLGIKIQPTYFARYKVGEGIEKKKVDFAAEVQAQLQSK